MIKALLSSVNLAYVKLTAKIRDWRKTKIGRGLEVVTSLGASISHLGTFSYNRDAIIKTANSINLPEL